MSDKSDKLTGRKLVTSRDMKIAIFEHRYKMHSDEFMKKWNAGELEDSYNFVYWAHLIHRREAFPNNSDVQIVELTASEKYLTQPYSKILTVNQDGSYTAEILEFSGCLADGSTPDEAIFNLDAAAKSWIEACQSRNIEIPQPFDNIDYIGKINIDIPRSLHRQAARIAERDGISLNEFIMLAISEKVNKLL